MLFLSHQAKAIFKPFKISGATTFLLDAIVVDPPLFIFLLWWGVFIFLSISRGYPRSPYVADQINY